MRKSHMYLWRVETGTFKRLFKLIFKQLINAIELPPAHATSPPFFPNAWNTNGARTRADVARVGPGAAGDGRDRLRPQVVLGARGVDSLLTCEQSVWRGDALILLQQHNIMDRPRPSATLVLKSCNLYYQRSPEIPYPGFTAS